MERTNTKRRLLDKIILLQLNLRVFPQLIKNNTPLQLNKSCCASFRLEIIYGFKRAD